MTKAASLPLALSSLLLLGVVPLTTACPKNGGGGGLQCVDGFVEDTTHEVCVAILPAADCPAGQRAQVGQVDCLPVGNVACAEGFEAAADGWGCEPILPTASCAAGTRPVLGETDCQPVGWTTCPAGFVPEPGGWGCIDQAPATVCSGATRATLDGQGCVPIGDCSAPFPPAGTTFHVNQAFTAGELDASHYDVLNDALAQARSGDLVAVYPGAYVDEISAYPGVKIVGKCAEEVSLDLVPGSTQPGALMFDGKVEIEGLSIRGHLIGVAVVQQGQLTLTEVLLEGNLDLGVHAADAGSEVVVRRSVIRSTRPSTGKLGGWGVNVESGARVVLEESEIVDSMGTAIFAQMPNTTFEASDTLIWQTIPDSGGRAGHGVHVQSGAVATLRRSAVAGSHTLGLYASGFGAEIVGENLVVRDTLPNSSGAFGVGAQVDTGGALDLTDSAILRSHVIGLLAFDARTLVDLERVTFYRNPTAPLPGGTRGIALQLGPTGTLTDVAVVEAGESGVVIGGAGANATIDGLLVQDTRPTTLGESGQGLWVADAGQLTATDLTILDNRARGILVQENAATAVIDGLLVEGTIASSPTASPNQGGVPIGLDSSDGGDTTCRRCVIRRNDHIGVRVTRAEGGSQPGRLTFEDGVIADQVHEIVGDKAGVGLVVYLDGSATVSRTTFARNSTTSLLVSSAGAQLSLTDATIKETRPGRSLEGYGIAVQIGAAASVSSLASVKNDGAAFWSQGVNTRVTLADSLFAFPEGAIEGMGVIAQDGASVELLRSEVNDNKIAGVVSAFPGTLLFVDQTLIRNTRPGTGGIADGAILWSNSRSTLNRSVIQQNEGIGLKIVSASARMNWTEVRENTVGIHATGGTAIQTGSAVPDDYETNVAFVADNCAFLENATRTGTGAVAVPEIESIPINPS